MPLIIDQQLKQRCPPVTLGCLAGRVSVSASPAGLAGELQTRAAEILRLPDPSSVLASPQIRATRSSYKALGKDPARYRGSAEALLRRIISGKPLPAINNVVDICNLVSIESRLSIGLYDSEKIGGEITFRMGGPGETYKGIGKYDLNLEGLPIFSDAAGPFGSPTSDSDRTMITPGTQQILMVLISFGGADQLGRWEDRTLELLKQYAAGEEFHAQSVG